jgi:hypothetical protein
VSPLLSPSKIRDAAGGHFGPLQTKVIPFEFMDGRFGTALIPGLLSKI